MATTDETRIIGGAVWMLVMAPPPYARARRALGPGTRL